MACGRGRVVRLGESRGGLTFDSLVVVVMSDIPKLLLDSLNPHTRKQAEQSLEAYSRQPAFVIHLLQLVLNPANDIGVRLAASVYLKNTVKLRWLEDVCPLRQSLLLIYRSYSFKG